MNSECAAGLTCSFGHCQAACKEARDCPNNEQCVKNASGINSCLVPAAETCSYNSQCGAPLVCGADLKCRNQCLADRDCVTSTQKCVLPDGVCAEPSAISNSGSLIGAVLDAGAPDVASAPDTSPDSPLVPIDAPTADVAVSPPDTADAAPACTGFCDDGLTCTTDLCVAGVCQSTPKLGYCVIDKACYMDGDSNPLDACKVCNITSSTSVWTAQPEGARCGTSKSCQSGVCAACGNVAQACCGTSPGTCVVGAACNSGTSKCEADKAIDISGSNDTFCALFKSGRVRCWGNTGAKLGIGSNTASSVAAPPVAGLEDAVQVSVGDSGVCAVRATGAVVCWGTPPGGTATNSTVAISGITNATQVSVGYQHACVRTADSKVLCWGNNSRGQFGIGTTSTTPTPTPTQMQNVADARSVAAGGSATCLLRSGGQVSCAGGAYENGQTADSSTVADLLTVSNVSLLSGNLYSSYGLYCAVAPTGALSCWSNYSNQQPTTVAGVGQVLAAGWSYYSYWAVQQDHTLWVLGSNGYGQLGDGTFTDASSHTSAKLVHAAGPVAGVVAVAVTHDSSCLLRTDGSVSCAGYGDARLGDGQQSPAAKRTPFVPVVGILPVASEDGQCFDGVDNDGDGKTDLDDPDCAQDLGSATGNSVATAPIAGVFGNYLQESCNVATGSTGKYGGPEAVLVWTAPSGGTYQFDTTGSSFDTVLAAFKGSPTTTGELDCNDDGTTLANGASLIQVKVITGDKLTLVIDTKAAPAATATFNLNITKQ
jgi:alpha-tubulin suppressor-like RCC1 family protein